MASGGKWTKPTASSLPDLSPDHDLGDHRYQRSYSYSQLIEPRVVIDVRRLDGSSFAVPIARGATVGELKFAVEDVFRRFVEESGFEISWALVWSQFCLCFNYYKLIDDKETLRSIGIEDGDELYFIRHFTVNHGSSGLRYQKRISRRSRSFQFSNDIDVIEQVEEENDNDVNVEELTWNSDLLEDDLNAGMRRHRKGKFCRLLRRFFSCSS